MNHPTQWHINNNQFYIARDDISPWTPAGQYNIRIKNLLIIGSYIDIATCTLWALFHIYNKTWDLTALSIIGAIIGLTSIFLIKRGCLRRAGIVMIHSLLFISVIASLGDAHIEGVQPSIHMYLLPIAAAAFLIFHRSGIYLRGILPVMTVCFFLAFALNLVPQSWSGMIEASKGGVAGVWINYLTGTVATCIVIAMMQSNMKARYALERDMRQAIAHGDYHLHYQPQVDAAGTVLGVEALLRWNHPTRGSISPQEFIPLAEETGLIIPIGDWVLRTACAKLAQWSKDPAMAGVSIAVNVSASQFRQPDFVQQVKNIVQLSNAPTARLKLELTESAVADDIETVIAKMQSLKDLGIRWSLDDFGTGYSSLSQLKRLPLDQLKIDQSFVRDLLTDKHDQAIVETVINLSHRLDLAVIAEGVETPEQLAALRSAGCRTYQGYLFSRPLTEAALKAFISSAEPHHIPTLGISPLNLLCADPL